MKKRKKEWLIDESVSIKEIIFIFILLVLVSAFVFFIIKNSNVASKLIGVIGEEIIKDVEYADLVGLILFSSFLTFSSWILSLYWHNKYKKLKNGM